MKKIVQIIISKLWQILMDRSWHVWIIIFNEIIQNL